jgi:Glycerophosphoryl diester phosphodiesterase family
VLQVYNRLFVSQLDGICLVSFPNVVCLNVFDSLGSSFGFYTDDRVVKESGLVCVSYGLGNNDKAFVRRQIEAGVDAVIVDSVLAIRNELTSGGPMERHNV